MSAPDGAPHPRRSFGCAIALIVLCTLGIALGGVTAVGVAWQIARQPPAFDTNRSDSHWSHSSGPAWLYQREESWGAVRLRGQFASAAASGNRRAVSVEPPPAWSELAQPSPNVTGAATKWEEAFGWPMPAMMSRIDQTRAVTRIVSGINITPRRQPWDQLVYLPTKPIWSGIAINALIFAPAWWIVLAMVVLLGRLILRVPRWLRKRRGRCPNCGYDLRGKLDDGCSECGWKRAPNATPSA